MNHANTNRSAGLARNVEVALRFKKSQGTQEMPQVEREVLAPNYDRVRGGNFHLASNARDQGFPAPGMYLRSAFPDRVDVIEEVIAEGDRVGLLFRVTGTHTGNFFGIPPTGKKIDVYEIAMLRIVNGQMVEGWFMMDETALLQQLGAKMPKRKDGKTIAPPLPNAGEDADVFVQRLAAQPPGSQHDRNKVVDELEERPDSRSPSAAFWISSPARIRQGARPRRVRTGRRISGPARQNRGPDCRGRPRLDAVQHRRYAPNESLRRARDGQSRRRPRRCDHAF